MSNHNRGGKRGHSAGRGQCKRYKQLERVLESLQLKFSTIDFHGMKDVITVAVRNESVEID